MDLLDAPVTALARRLRMGELRSIDLVEAHIARIEIPVAEKRGLRGVRNAAPPPLPPRGAHNVRHTPGSTRCTP